ncbi:MAG: hypothetical protein ACRYF2_05275 [Janthinobacterium lividum]
MAKFVGTLVPPPSEIPSAIPIMLHVEQAVLDACELIAKPIKQLGLIA